jgi:hypothetical protein
MVPLVLIASASFAQDDNRAVPRGSGSSGSSSAGERHTGGSSSGSSASSDSGNRGGSSSAGSGREYIPAPDAASRRPRPGTGTGTRDRFGNDRDRYVGSPYSSYYYDPYYYSSFGYSGRPYGRLGYGYGYYDYGYSYGDYWGYYPSYYSRSYRYRAGNVAQLRTLVEPSKTRVYVDGYYAGTVDDFDGLLQRLNVSPGRHDITLRLEGYQSHTFSVYANREQTLKLRWDMVRGNGETRDTVGEEYARRSDPGDDPDDDNEARERELERERERADRGGEVDSDRNDRRPPMPREGRDGARGEVALDIQPLDASVYVDGEFYGKASQVAHLELAVGRHRIEVVRPGYRTEETEVTVDREPRKLVVKLERR